MKFYLNPRELISTQCLEKNYAFLLKISQLLAEAWHFTLGTYLFDINHERD